MKTIVFYLPQFHAIPLNDKYWGKGFTEWVNVKKSKSLFKGHKQPEVPLNNNYYNLLDAETQIYQAEIAKEYGIDGFCYYHYWFSGELLLEKPMENMLQNKKIDIPFCCCWANEHWSKNWDGQPNKVIMKQNYNENEEEWRKHYEYLSPFFHDSRYIKKENMPVFIIYKPYLMNNCQGMLAFWNTLAKEEGFDGIYFGYQYPDSFKHNTDGFNFGIEFEPLYTVKCGKNVTENKTKYEKILYSLVHWGDGFKCIRNSLKFRWERLTGKPMICNYDEVWNEIISRPLSENIMPGAFPAWDNTPRRGKFGTVFFESTPDKFGKYMSELVKKVKDNSEFLFINAWNEWGEGAHLEPDENNRFGYLENLREALRN